MSIVVLCVSLDASEMGMASIRVLENPFIGEMEILLHATMILEVSQLQRNDI